VEGLRVSTELDPTPTPPRPRPLEADVVRDRVQPGGFRFRDDASPQGPERVEKRRLDRVLGLLARAELAAAEAEDAVGVALE
jgi:hypothetical protein